MIVDVLWRSKDNDHETRSINRAFVSPDTSAIVIFSDCMPETNLYLGGFCSRLVHVCEVNNQVASQILDGVTRLEPAQLRSSGLSVLAVCRGTLFSVATVATADQRSSSWKLSHKLRFSNCALCVRTHEAQYIHQDARQRSRSQ